MVRKAKKKRVQKTAGRTKPPKRVKAVKAVKRVKRSAARPRYKLTDIIPLERLQAIQDSFTGAFDVPVLFLDEAGMPITRSLHMPQFCGAWAASAQGEGKPVCPKCGREVSMRRIAAALARRGQSARPFMRQCPGGRSDYYIPIRYRASLVGFCVAAQSAQMVDPRRYSAFAEQLGLQPEKAVAAIRSVRILPRAKLKRLGALLCDLLELATAAAGSAQREKKKRT